MTAQRISKILAKARLTLADPNKERWSDETLLAILDEAQNDFCQQTRVLRTKVEVPLQLGTAYFDLPNNCWLLTRVLYDNEVIPMLSHAELDGYSYQYNGDTIFFGCDWENDTGIPQAVIYDRTSFAQGKVYPIPSEAAVDIMYSYEDTGVPTSLLTSDYGVIATIVGDALLVSDYGVISGASDSYSVSSDYGIATTLYNSSSTLDGKFGFVVDIEDYSFNSLFGLTVDLTSATIDSIYGVLSSLSLSPVLTCYYLSNPTEIVDETSELSIPPMYDMALKFYVCGQAFMNDIDTGYQQKGAAQMMIYERHVKTAKKDSSLDFTAASQFTTTYRRSI